MGMIAVPIVFDGEGEFDPPEYGKMVLKSEDVRFFYAIDEDAKVIKFGLSGGIFACADPNQFLSKLDTNEFVKVPITVIKTDDDEYGYEGKEELETFLYFNPGYLTSMYIMQADTESGEGGVYFNLYMTGMYFYSKIDIEDFVGLVSQ